MIGNKCHINYEACIDRHITIKNNVGVGHRSFLVTFNHDYSNPYGRFLGRMIFNPIVVGQGAWIGAKVTILASVEIGEGAIVGAGSEVTKNIPDNYMIADNSAKIIKKFSS